MAFLAAKRTSTWDRYLRLAVPRLSTPPSPTLPRSPSDICHRREAPPLSHPQYPAGQTTPARQGHPSSSVTTAPSRTRDRCRCGRGEIDSLHVHLARAWAPHMENARLVGRALPCRTSESLPTPSTGCVSRVDTRDGTAALCQDTCLDRNSFFSAQVGTFCISCASTG